MLETGKFCKDIRCFSQEIGGRLMAPLSCTNLGKCNEAQGDTWIISPQPGGIQALLNIFGGRMKVAGNLCKLPQDP